MSDIKKLSKICVIIPYYQRQSGILSRALASIYAQDYSGPVKILIVDDASPLPADGEVKRLARPGNIEISIVKQPNKGPGGARNTGLDHAAGEDIIAFLDSDDEWTPEHLSRAAAALNAGHDIYAANWRLTDNRDAYEIRAITPDALRAIPGLDHGGALPRPLIEQHIAAPIIKLSALAYARAPFADIRFNTTLRTAMEDGLFVLDMALRDPRVFLSLQQECLAGRGENIHESKAWGTNEHFQVIADQIAGYKLALAKAPHHAELQRLYQANLVALRRNMWRNFFHLIKRGKLSSLTYMGYNLARDSGTLAALPAAIFGAP